MSEWWIQDGRAVHADGDVGDMNHEAYVVDHLSRVFLTYMGLEGQSAEAEYLGSLSCYDDQIAAWLIRHGVPVDDARNDPRLALSMLSKRMVPRRFKTVEQFEEALSVAYGAGRSRAADYAQEFEGWKRVAGCWVETWTLTRDDLKSIVDGLSDAAGDEMSDDTTFSIEVRAARTEYRDIPWAVLEAATCPTDLREYAIRHRSVSMAQG